MLARLMASVLAGHIFLLSPHPRSFWTEFPPVSDPLLKIFSFSTRVRPTMIAARYVDTSKRLTPYLHDSSPASFYMLPIPGRRQLFSTQLTLTLAIVAQAHMRGTGALQMGSCRMQREV